MKVLTVKFDVTGLTDDEIAALTGEVIVQGESSDDHCHAPFLSEDVTEENDSVTQALAAMLSDDRGEIAQVIHAGTQTGRGPSGKLRNFRQMADAKLEDVWHSVTQEDNDNEALDAIETELRSRGSMLV